MSNAYTDKQTAKAIELYEKNPCLEAIPKIAIELNKTSKSVIAKLSKEGVYRSKGYFDKRGLRPESKLSISKNIESILGGTFIDLEKAPKSTLQDLRKKLMIYVKQINILEKKIEIYNVREQMQKAK